MAFNMVNLSAFVPFRFGFIWYHYLHRTERCTPPVGLRSGPQRLLLLTGVGGASRQSPAEVAPVRRRMRSSFGLLHFNGSFGGATSQPGDSTGGKRRSVSTTSVKALCGGTYNYYSTDHDEIWRLEQMSAFLMELRKLTGQNVQF